MKGIFLALFCAVALVSAELNENGCPINPYVDILKPHPDCNKYYQCVQGELFERNCAADLVFNEETQECDWGANVECGNRPVVPESSEEAGNDSNATGDSNESENNNNGDSSHENSGNNENSSSNESENNSNNNNGGNGNPSEAAEICSAKGSNGVLVAHENCNQFYKCSYGVPVAMDCWPGLLFNYETDQCDWPENVNCEGRNQGGNDNGNDNNGSNGDEDKEDEDNSSDSGNGDDDNNDSDADNNNNGGGHANPSEAPKICAREDSDSILVAHENCNQYYVCKDGAPVSLNCNPNLYFNPATDACEWPETVNCEGRNQDGNDNENDNNGGNGDEDKEVEDNSSDNDSGNGAGNANPSEAPEICAREDSDSILVAHENCNQYYVCKDGAPVSLHCNPNLYFNPATDACDWPETVNCEGRNPDGNGDEDNSSDNDSGNGAGNANPSEAPEICAREDSDSILVAHENCNQYYVCKDGVPVTLNCNPNLHFNPAADACDWAENVNCGNRRSFASINKHLLRFLRLSN